MHQRVQERGVRVPSQRTPNWQLFCEVCWHRTKNDRRVINPGWGTCTEGTCWPCGTLYVIIIIITTRSFTAKACVRQANSVAHRLLRRKPRGVAFLDDVEEGSLRDLFAYTSACKEMGLGFRDGCSTSGPSHVRFEHFAPCYNLGSRRNEPGNGVGAPARLCTPNKTGNPNF